MMEVGYIVMTEKKIYVLCITFSLLFVGIMDYPFISRIYNGKKQAEVVSECEDAISNLSDEKCEQELTRAKEYNEILSVEGATSMEDAFSNNQKVDREYLSILNVDKKGVMGSIELPSIHLSLPIYHGTSEKSLQQGAGHLEGTSLPIGGSGTHTCISAHRGLPGKTLFTNLDQLKNGDVFCIHIFQTTLTYEITKIETVTPDCIESLAIQPGQDLATLITCTPYGINTHRMYVHGKRIPNKENMDARENVVSVKYFWRQYWWIGLNILIFAWIGFMMYRIHERLTERKNVDE